MGKAVVFIDAVQKMDDLTIGEIESAIEDVDYSSFIIKSAGLAFIVRKALYRPTYLSAEQYAEDRLGWSRQQLWRYTKAYDFMVRLISIFGEGCLLPTRESYCRSLTKEEYDDPFVTNVWSMVTKLVREKNKKMTAAMIEDCINLEINRVKEEDPEEFIAQLKQLEPEDLPSAQSTPPGMEVVNWGWVDLCWDVMTNPEAIPPSALGITGNKILITNFTAKEYYEVIRQRILEAPQWNFLLLPAFPFNIQGDDLPSNAWEGYWVRTNREYEEAHEYASLSSSLIRFLVFAPTEAIDLYIDNFQFEWVIHQEATSLEWATIGYRKVKYQTSAVQFVREFPAPRAFPDMKKILEKAFAE